MSAPQNDPNSGPRISDKEKFIRATDELFQALIDEQLGDVAFLRLASDKICQTVGADRVFVWTRDDAARLVSAITYRADTDDFASGEAVDLTLCDAFGARISAERLGVYQPASPMNEAGLDLASCAFAQIHGAGASPGVLAAGMIKDARAWSQDELGFLAAAAGVIAVLWARRGQRATLLELQDLRDEAELAHRQLIEAVEASPDGFVFYDTEDRLVLCNQTYKDIYSHIADVIVPGNTFEAIIRTGVERGLQPEAEGREEAWIRERVTQHRNPSGSVEQELPGDRWLRITERRTATGDIVGFRTDITALKRQQRRLELLASELEASKAHAEHEALHDGLTGLPNRRHLDRKLSALEADPSDQGLVFLLHVDLDRFKQVNDTLGHAAGDFVLKHVSSVLQRVAAPSDFIARIGGDEFTMLRHRGATAEESRRLGERIVAELSTPVTFEGNPCRFGASVGVASSPASAASQLLLNADIALYEAKGGGRGRVEIFGAELEERHTAKMRLAEDILRGLEADEFEPFFQPQFSAADGRFVGVEALARWRHPERGVVPPAAFIEVADELSVLDVLDRRIFQLSLEACDRLAARGVEVPKLSVNVSLERLRQSELLSDVPTSGGPRIAFELLETIYFDEKFDEIQMQIDGLRELGVDVEIDDFGSGRASIISMLKIRPTRFKIDRNLVMPIAESADYRRIIGALIEIGHGQDISVTAEGVETQEHVDILRDLGCDTLQGFHFARPISERDLGDMLIAAAWPKAAAL